MKGDRIWIHGRLPKAALGGVGWVWVGGHSGHVRAQKAAAATRGGSLLRSAPRVRAAGTAHAQPHPVVDYQHAADTQCKNNSL